MNPTLQRRIEEIAAGIRGRLGCFVSDLEGNVWAACRIHETFEVASIIKVPILAAVGTYVDRGHLAWNTEVPNVHQERALDSGLVQHLSTLRYTVHDLAMLMIAVSDNRATNALVDLIGWENVNAYFRETGWKATVLARRLGDFAARAQGYQNLSSPWDIGDCLLRLVQERLVSPETTAILMGTLRAQIYRDGLRGKLPRAALVAHKTGDMPGVEGDAAIMWLRSGTVVAVVLTDGLSDDLEGRLAIETIGQLVADAGGGCVLQQSASIDISNSESTTSGS